MGGSNSNLLLEATEIVKLGKIRDSKKLENLEKLFLEVR